MKHVLSQLLSIGLTAALALAAHAKEHLVGDRNQFDTAVSQAKPGDFITLKDGPWEDVELEFDAGGAPNQPITVRAQTPGKVVVGGASQLRIGGSHLVVDGLFFHHAHNGDHLVLFRRDSKHLARDCRLTNCAFLDCNDPAETGETRWISLYGQHNRLDHCWIQGKTTKGTTLVVWVTDQPNEHQIDHNYFGPRPKLGKNGGETIRIGDSKTSLLSSRTTVEANLFVECDGESEIVSNKSCDNIYRGNAFVRCSGALTMRHGNRCLAEGNFFLGERARGSGGVRIIGEGHRVINNYFADLEGDDLRAAISVMNGIKNSPPDGYLPVKNAVVAFNTLVNCKQSLVIGISNDGGDVAPADCTVANNLIVARRPAIDVRTEPTNWRWQGNLLAQSGSEPPSIPGVELIDDAGLEKSPDGRWRPGPNSPAIAAAVGDFADVAEDIDGQPRSAKKDVGSDQRSSAPPVRVRPSAKTVGPSWQVPAPAGAKP